MEKRPPQTKVKVVVRLRPTNSPNEKSCVNVVGNNVQILNHRNTDERLLYEFHTVYDEKASQADVFSTSVEPILQHVLHGQNISVFAYGPTGAGKTHTMLGMPSDPGIIPRVIKSLFKAIHLEESSVTDNPKQASKFQVTFSYLEIYNEKVHDLLVSTHQDLPIREDASRNIFVTDLTQKSIDGFKTFMGHFQPASSNRTVGATNLNKYSSRSHTILMLKVCRTEPDGKVLRGKLYLIDLAGSEDNRRTGNKGIRLKESGAINKSLFVLGEVVDAINHNLPCVPYRNSKLTRLLQDSIGGSCHSLMITNIAPEERFYYDTYCTLNFATKSKKIVNTITTDVVSLSDEKPTATVRPIKRHRASLSISRPEPLKQLATYSKDDSDSISALALPSFEAASLTHLPSPLLRQQRAFELAIQEKISTMQKLVENMHQSTANTNSLSEVSSSLTIKSRNASLASDHDRQSLKGSRNGSLDSMSSSSSPDVVCPTPVKKLRDTTNLLKQRHFGQVQSKPPMKVMNVATSDSPFFPRKRGSSSDFESPIMKKVKAAPGIFNNADQTKRNADFLEVLNTATVKELQNLQTVGVKRAKMIYQWREHHGIFASTQDVLQVPGFTEKVLNKLLRSNFVTDASEGKTQTC